MFKKKLGEGCLTKQYFTIIVVHSFSLFFDPTLHIFNFWLTQEHRHLANSQGTDVPKVYAYKKPCYHLSSCISTSIFHYNLFV